MFKTKKIGPRLEWGGHWREKISEMKDGTTEITQSEQ